MKKRLLTALLAAVTAAALAVPASAAEAVPVRRADYEANYATVAVGGYVYTSIKGPLERISLQTQERKTVVPEDKAYSLKQYLVQAGKLYWSGGNTIYYCNTDGTGVGRITAGTAKQTVSNLRTTDGWLYCLLGGGLYRMKADGTGKARLAVGEVERFELAGPAVCYRPKGGDELHRCGLDGKDDRVLGELGAEWEPELYGDTLYYAVDGKWNRLTGNGNLKRSGRPSDRLPSPYTTMHLPSGAANGNTVQIFRSEENGNLKNCFSISNAVESTLRGSKNFLYYQQTGEKSGLYRVDWNGKNRNRMADGGEPLFFSGGYLVYQYQNDIHLLKDA